jgi:hypothetical protein
MRREEELDQVLARLAHALRTDDPRDVRAGLLEVARAAAPLLGGLSDEEGWRRVGTAAAVLGVPAPAPGDPLDAAGLTPPGGYALVGPQRLPLQAQLEGLLVAAPLDPDTARLLGELARAPVASELDTLRCHLAILRGLDQALDEARHAEEEPELAARIEPLRRAAIEAAERQGARVWPAAGQALVRRGEAPCPVRELPDFGPPGRIAWVEGHGFVLPDGRSEEARVRVARDPAPPELPLLLEGYRALRRRRRLLPEQAQAWRGWLRELPAAGPEGRVTTLRYAATAVFALVEQEPAARPLFERFVGALEAAGSFLIPLDPRQAWDPSRYEVQLRAGAGAPRLIRPGFQTREQLVQQRARVLLDPGRLGAG